MELDIMNCAYVLNRALAYLKLERWADAEEDATLAFEKLVVSGLDKQKAVFRRCQARISQRKVDLAREDINIFRSHGAECKDVNKLESDLEASHRCDTRTASQKPPQEPNVRRPKCLFEIKDSTGAGLGAFATRDLRGGDLVLAETPIFSNAETDTVKDTMESVKERSSAQLVQILSLKNAKSNSIRHANHFQGIVATNAFEHAGLCLRASQFNHSCSPNAKYSGHERTGCERIYALGDILAGEEILVSYLGRRLHGTPREQRCSLLQENYNFVCNCCSCFLEGPAQVFSDQRRLKLGEISKELAQFEAPEVESTAKAEKLVHKAVEAFRLLKDERLLSDADDYVAPVANLCSIRSDWDSTVYWSKFVYQTRRAEFGEDHKHTKEAKDMFQHPTTHFPNAGYLSLPKLSIRLDSEL